MYTQKPKKLKFSLIVVVIASLMVSSAPVGSADENPEVREACLVYTAISTPLSIATTAVGCAFVAVHSEVLSCTPLLGGNKTEENVSYQCTISTDWQFWMAHAGNFIPRDGWLKAWFSVDGEIYQEASSGFIYWAAHPSIRVEPRTDTINVAGSEPYELMGELCVQYSGQMKCNTWLIATLYPWSS